VRYHLLKKYLLCPLLCFGLFSLDGIVFAQVYKSYDADGNVIFSDKPTEGGKEVEVTEPNLSDSFEIPPPPPAEPLPETNPEAESEPEPAAPPIADGKYIDTNKDGRISRREREDQRDERNRKKREKKKAAEGEQE
jgi:hypothetical protein